MNDSTDSTLEKSTQEDKVLQAIAELFRKIDDFKKESDSQFEAIRSGIVENSARFDQLEALAHDAKSIALITRSQLTILTEEFRREKLALQK